MRALAAAIALCLAAGSSRAAAPPRPHVFSRRYVLVFANLGRPQDLDKVLGILRRASSAGYNGLVLGSRAGEYIDLVRHPPSSEYRAGFATLVREARTVGMKVIPYAINPNEVGYAAPELSEAIPCHGTEFVAHGGTAVVAAGPSPLSNPSFDDYAADSPAAWGHDKPGVITFVDTAVAHGGKASVRIQDTGRGDPVNGHGRLWQEVRVTPYRAYEFSVWIKTRNLTDPERASFYFEGLDGGQPLVYVNREAGLGAPLRGTQDWTQYTVRFNSASNSRLALFMGVWSPRSSGTIWFDDADMREIGLVHTVRRDSLPVTVTSADGTRTYREGADYAVADGRLELPAGSAIREGDRLQASWYQRGEMIGPPFANAAHPRYFQVEESIARQLDGLFGRPSGFMMTFDEWRIANWDPAAGAVTAGEYMAGVVRQSSRMLKDINPRYELYVWSDMFDPNENALDKYLLCNGPVTGSWKGLDPRTVIMTWTGGQKALRFFSDHGFRQVVAGYYESVANVRSWMDDVDKVEAVGAKGIDGFMYTTWQDRFEDLEAVAVVLRERGRWPGPSAGARRE